MGNFLADFYSVNGLVLESRKRREHLSEEDILRNKAIMESLSKGGNLIEQNFEVCHVIIVSLTCDVISRTGIKLMDQSFKLHCTSRFILQCDGW